MSNMEEFRNSMKDTQLQEQGYYISHDFAECIDVMLMRIFEESKLNEVKDLVGELNTRLISELFINQGETAKQYFLSIEFEEYMGKTLNEIDVLGYVDDITRVLIQALKLSFSRVMQTKQVQTRCIGRDPRE